MREVKAQCRCINIRTLLFYVVSKNLLQSIVKQVGCSVISCASVTLVNIYTSHEVCVDILRQLLNDMNALVVFAFSINDFYCFVFANQRTLITNLTTHFTIERSLVKYKFKECILLLSHFAIAQYVAFIFCVVISYEFLFTILDDFPVSAFYDCGIACTCFLLCHFLVKAFLVYCISVFTANQFR